MKNIFSSLNLLSRKFWQNRKKIFSWKNNEYLAMMNTKIRRKPQAIFVSILFLLFFFQFLSPSPTLWTWTKRYFSPQIKDSQSPEIVLKLEPNLWWLIKYSLERSEIFSRFRFGVFSIDSPQPNISRTEDFIFHCLTITSKENSTS